MSKQLIFQAGVAGILAGFILGFSLKFIQEVSGLLVYTLLMNVDYIPVLKQFQFTEWIEFSFHLVISVVIGVLIMVIAIKQNWSAQWIIYYTIIINVCIAIIIYPTTLFSTRTPPLLSVPSIGMWISAHLLYGIVLGSLLMLILRKKRFF